MNNVNFPRGKDPISSSSQPGDDENVVTSSRNDDLFKSKSAKVKKIKKKSILTGEEINALAGRKKADQRPFDLQQLTYDTLTEGVLSLGRVIKVQAHQVLVSLPGRTVGAVSITNVSTPYSDALDQMAKGTLPKDVVVHPLEVMFKPGMIIIVKVLAVTTTDKGTHRVSLSTNPVDLHSNWTCTLLTEDLVFTGAVKSAEEHGYQMDLGMTGVTAFLLDKHVKDFIKKLNNGQPLGIGQLVPVKISKCVIHRLMATLSVTAMPNILRTSVVKDDAGINYNMLLPGMAMESIVMQPHKTGIKVHCLELHGLIHADHLEDVWKSALDIPIAEKVQTRVLYTLPNGTSPYLTLQRRMVPYLDSELTKQSIPSGSLEQVLIVRQEKRGLIIRVGNDQKGIVPIQRCLDESVTTEDDVAKKYPQGSRHQCRILDYAAVDKMYVGSLNKSLMDKNVLFKPEHVTPGMVVKCKVKSWNAGGAVVEIGPNLQGFIPKVHFGDRAVSDPHKKYPVDSKLNGRVLSINLKKNSIRITGKKSLVRSTGAVLTSYDEVNPGMVGDGTVRKVTKAGIQVEVLGGLMGFMPASKITRPEGITLEMMFKEDQTVRFTVLEMNMEKKQMILGSFKEEEEEEMEGEKKEVLKDGQNSRKRKIEEKSGGEGKKKKKVKKVNNKEVVVEDKEEVEEVVGEEKKALSVKVGSAFWDTKALVKKVKGDDDQDSLNLTCKTEKKGKKVEEAEPEEEDMEVDLPASSSTEFLETLSYEQFEEALQTSRNEVSLWKRYVDAAVKAGDITKARSIIYKGVDLIDYREEKKKLALWYLLIDIEVKYGDVDTLRSSLKEAESRADKYNIIQHLAFVYERNNKTEEAEKTYKRLIKEFSLVTESYKRCGAFYYNNGRLADGRKIFLKGQEKVAASEQIKLAMAHLKGEFKFGEAEMGKQIMETLLKTYPKRSDLWLACVDALISNKDYDGARKLFSRVLVDSDISGKKILPFVSKYMNFESEHGDEATRAAMQKAVGTFVKKLDQSRNKDNIVNIKIYC